MKITRIFPKFLAKTYQEEDLRRVSYKLQYHKEMVRVLEELAIEGQTELQRLEKLKWLFYFKWKIYHMITA